MSDDVFYIKEGDTGPVIATVLLDPDDEAANLSSASVVFRMADEDGTLVQGDAVVTDANAGAVQYEWVDGDTDVWGGYQAEWVVTQGGVTETFPSAGYNFVEVVPNVTTTIRGICSLARVRRALGRAMTDAEQAKAAYLIQSLMYTLERHLNRKLAPTTIVETHRITTDGRVIPYQGPVVDVAGVSLDGVVWTGDLTTWEDVDWYGNTYLTLTYTAGVVPDAGVKDMVANVIARTLSVASSVAVGAIKSYSVEGTSITYGDVSGSDAGSVGRYNVGDLGSLARLYRPVFRA